MGRKEISKVFFRPNFLEMGHLFGLPQTQSGTPSTICIYTRWSSRREGLGCQAPMWWDRYHVVTWIASFGLYTPVVALILLKLKLTDVDQTQVSSNLTQWNLNQRTVILIKKHTTFRNVTFYYNSLCAVGCWSRNIPAELVQYHDCWRLGSLCRQVTNRNGI